ncbi:hypothetical protein FGADI_1874 [Fusarium gaditjirri]|uniref:Apple domain-containing protein n=1 Tax=Fusarium gaditjirri TaxID=282569 RepID=A0A8H4X2Y5_9HYPO|nr:hypothetical protein FGADI_1874 [Fusarium gaditjirri]
MVATRFLMLSLAAAVAVAGPCKPQSSSIVFSETTLLTSLLEATSTEVPGETSTSEPTSTTIIESSVTSAAETATTTAVTTFSSAETTTEAASVPTVAAVPPQRITCPAAHGQCIDGFKIECGYIMTGGFGTPFQSTLDSCAAACNGDSGCAGFSHNGVSCYLVSSSYTTAPADWVTGKKDGCAQ